MDPKIGPDPKTQLAVGAKGVSNTYMDMGATKAEYTWPPQEFAWIPSPWFDIQYARVETWVPGNSTPICSWRAHEWHHIGIRWTDDTKGHAFTDDPTALDRDLPRRGQGAGRRPAPARDAHSRRDVYTAQPPGQAGAMHRAVFNDEGRPDDQPADGARSVDDRDPALRAAQSTGQSGHRQEPPAEGRAPDRRDPASRGAHRRIVNTSPAVSARHRRSAIP